MHNKASRLLIFNKENGLDGWTRPHYRAALWPTAHATLSIIHIILENTASKYECSSNCLSAFEVGLIGSWWVCFRLTALLISLFQCGCIQLFISLFSQPWSLVNVSISQRLCRRLTFPHQMGLIQLIADFSGRLKATGKTCFKGLVDDEYSQARWGKHHQGSTRASSLSKPAIHNQAADCSCLEQREFSCFISCSWFLGPPLGLCRHRIHQRWWQEVHAHVQKTVSVLWSDEVNANTHNHRTMAEKLVLEQ